MERVIRTIRQRLATVWEAQGLDSRRSWLIELPRFASAYNNRIHSSTQQRPLDLVVDPLLVPASRSPSPETEAKKLPPVGSFVRLNKLRGLFEKEARGTWTGEVFKVNRHTVHQSIPMAHVEDLLGEPIIGAFYPEELQQIDWEEERKEVAQVLSRRRGRGKAKFLVSYKGWPPNFTEWVDEVPPHLL